MTKKVQRRIWIIERRLKEEGHVWVPYDCASWDRQSPDGTDAKVPMTKQEAFLAVDQYNAHEYDTDYEWEYRAAAYERNDAV